MTQLFKMPNDPLPSGSWLRISVKKSMSELEQVAYLHPAQKFSIGYVCCHLPRASLPALLPVQKSGRPVVAANRGAELAHKSQSIERTRWLNCQADEKSMK